MTPSLSRSVWLALGVCFALFIACAVVVSAQGEGEKIVFEDVLTADDATFDSDDDEVEDDSTASRKSKVGSEVATSKEEDDEEEEDEEKTRVVQLTPSSFLELLDTVNNLVVIFIDHTNSCYACELGISLFEEFALEDEWKAVEFGVFDCQSDVAICSRYSVTEYPTIKLFNEGLGIYEFTKPAFTRAEFERYLRFYTAPKFEIVKTPEELQKSITSKFISLTYFRKEDDEKLLGSFERTAAELFEQLAFVRVELEAQTPEILAQFSAQSGDFVLVKNAHEIRPISYTTFEEPSVSRSKLRDWIKRHYALPVTDFTKHAFANAYALGLPVVVAHVPYDDEQVYRKTIKTLWDLQEIYPNQYTFGYMDITKEDELSLQRLGIYDKTKATFYIHSIKNSHLFNGDTSSVVALHNWLIAYQQGRLLRHSIRQPLPATPEYINGVLTLVHDNFRKVVFDEDKDAVVFFYLPESSCEPCKTLLPIFEQVAQEFAKWSDSIVFGKINMYLNEAAPGVHVTNFPTIKYFAADMKSKEFTFSGPRSVENLRKFIHDSSSFELTAEEGKSQQGNTNTEAPLSHDIE